MLLLPRTPLRADGQSPPDPDPTARFRSTILALVLIGGLGGCGDEGTDNPNGSGPLPPTPVLLEPASGTTLDTDNPLFTVRNAQGFDYGQADYTFWVTVASTDRHVATVVVPAGHSTTSVRFDGPLLRGATLAWFVTAVNSSGAETASGSATFRLPPVECETTADPYAKSIEGFWVPAVCLAQNAYNDPEEALGPPNYGGNAVEGFTGFVSLGNGGWVDVDMQACAVDGEGRDVRVWQAVAGEEVTLFASSSPEGPWVLVRYRNSCRGRCGFDLADAGIEEARYFRVQDGELFPCPGDTSSEGADIDAVEILNPKP